MDERDLAPLPFRMNNVIVTTPPSCASGISSSGRIFSPVHTLVFMKTFILGALTTSWVCDA